MKFFSIKFIVLLLILVESVLNIRAQTTYRVYFTDKANTEYNPFTYLDKKAIDRRLIHGLDICDMSDYPLNESYLLQVAILSDSILGVSRWMNAIFIHASNANISVIQRLPFVKKVETSEAIFRRVMCSEEKENNKDAFDTALTDKKKSLLAAQINRMEGRLLMENNLDGKGVRIAIIDVGFKSFLTNPVFKHIIQRNGIIATYDFVKKKPYTNHGISHGTNVFSCIAGVFDSIYPIGLATGSEFLLARTENLAEFFKEEENWLLAAEWADKNGADIINSSLGYTDSRYLPENMDGKTAFVSRAAQLAVDKGILVVCSAGNEGEEKWKRVAAPGDAAGVLTVGGIDPATGIHMGFSSYGPSWDRRLKPEVCAYGQVIAAGKNGLFITEGTSFSAPLVTGFAACVKQKYPTLTNIQLKDLICHSGDLWPYYDYAHGYGVPKPFFLFKDTLINTPTLTILEDNEDITLYPIEWDTALTKMNVTDSISPLPTHTILFDTLGTEMDSIPLLKIDLKDTMGAVVVVTAIWKQLFAKSQFKTTTPPYLFYHIKNRKGYIDKYFVMDLEDEKNGSVSISKESSKKPFSIEFYYRGYYKEIIIKE